MYSVPTEVTLKFKFKYNTTQQLCCIDMDLNFGIALYTNMFFMLDNLFYGHPIE